MRSGTSRGPFFLREWLPQDDRSRDQALIGAIGASDPLQLDGLGGGSTLTCKTAIVSRSRHPDCDLDYLFAQVGVGHQSVDTRPNCGNMLAGVVPFAIEQGLIAARSGYTTARVFNVNTGARIDVTVCTPGGRLTYDGETRIDGVAGTGAPILLNFLDAWGAVTGKLFPTGNRIDSIYGIEVSCIDAAMPLMLMRAGDLGLSGRERPAQLDANASLLERIERLRLVAGERMGLGNVAQSVIPKPVIVSAGDGPDSVTSRYFTPRRCHSSHAVTGAIGVATAFALHGTVASGTARAGGKHALSVLHPEGRIEVEVEIEGEGGSARVHRAALVRTARKIMQGELHLPRYVFTSFPSIAEDRPAATEEAGAFPNKDIRIIVPTSAGGANDTMARAIARGLSPLLGHAVTVDNRAGANGSVASEYVAGAEPDGHTLMFGYIATHGINPALQALRYDPIADFAPVGLVGYSPTLLAAHPDLPEHDVRTLVASIGAQPHPFRYAAAGEGTVPHLAAEVFQLETGLKLTGTFYSGAAPAIAEVARGNAHFMFSSLFTALPYLRSSKLRALAVAGPRRLPQLPDVPTLAEAGMGDIDFTQWYALFAPARTPEPIVNQLNQALNTVLEDPELVARVGADGTQVQRSTISELQCLLQNERQKWRQVIERVGLRLEAEALE